ncbi:MAG: M28 family peptidase, partial [Acidobacteriota bacterium]
MRILIVLGCLGMGLVSGGVEEVMREPGMRGALEWMRTHQGWTLEQQISICEIAAPPFGEAERGKEFARRLGELGMEEVRTDSEGNVISRLPGTKGGKPVVVLSAHLDTVFPAGMDVKVYREGKRLRGLGMGDDCRGLAVVLTVARALRDVGGEIPGAGGFVGTGGGGGGGGGL